MTDEVRETWIKNFEQDEYYSHVKYIDGRGFCGIMEFVFTIGVCEGLDSLGYEGRWCYPKHIAAEAVIALLTWDGADDPAGKWVKYKGRTGERYHPDDEHIK